MSGLLRRIKRSRSAGAGDAPAEGQAAGPEDAPTTADGPDAGIARPDAASDPSGGPAAAEPASAPALVVDPDAAAGLDPAEAADPRVTGRRSRLRRRLRYLRRARELMLRDVGGLVYEIHRSGGGDIAAHAGVIGPKVDRLAQLDKEARAIEAALGAPRPDDEVFQPGVGGTCDFCGELYGSAARFCSHCGSPTGSAVRATPAPLVQRLVPPMPKPPAAPAKEEVEAPAAGEPPGREAGRPAEPSARLAWAAPSPPDDASAGAAPGGSDQPLDTETTRELPAAEGAAGGEAGADGPPGAEPAAEAPPGSEGPAGGEPAHGGDVGAEAPPDAEASREAPAGAADEPGDAPRNPFASLPNGRPDDAPPKLSSGDPLTTEDSRP